MSINDRINRLEQRMGAGGCPECGGGPRVRLLPIRIGEDSDDRPAPELAPCPTCGEVPVRVRMRPVILEGNAAINGLL